MSNSGQFITIQRAKEKNQTEQRHLPTPVCYEKKKRKIHYQGNTIVYNLLIYFGQADEGHKTLNYD